MGRPSKLNYEKFNKLADEFVTSKSINERVIICLMEMNYQCGHLESILHCKKITSYKLEVHVGCGRIDMLLFHSESEVSIVEAKSSGRPSAVCGGIGQLFMYEAALIKKFKKSKINKINKILVAPIDGEDSAPIIEACNIAGIEFAHYATYNEILKQRTNLIDKIKYQHG